MELDLLRKFDAKTNRVKGLAFHPFRPWILASLHNGIIQLYDYRMEILLHSFEEHEGPVRGIDFHKTQPLFVSGGDDYKVKVWNYQNKRCLYTLHGHLDYIRTVYFHPSQYPWILSASDDQTVRIWNWQSRTCLLVLTGHNHYVMCAKWHATDDLILSASLDQTIRVWDISGLRKRSTSIVDTDNTSSSNYGSSGSGSGSASDVFGNVDASVKFVLEGHSRGVNWAAFHPTMQLVVSGADDREIKVWRMSGSRAWETTTYRGHLNNVSCVLFHAKENIIISNSEDKTLRVWDVGRNHPPLTFRRDNDRYWILAAHPRLNLLAAGHDNGMLIFKLSRERPAYYFYPNDYIYYYNEGYIRSYNINNGNDKALMQSRSSSSGGGGSSSSNYSSNYGGSGSSSSSITGLSSSKRSKRPRHLLYNPYSSSKEINILMYYDSITGISSSKMDKHSHSHHNTESEYELYVMDKKGNNKSVNNRSLGRSVAFVNRNRFGVLDNNGEIILKNMNNENKKKIKISERNVNYIFEGGINRLILRSPEWITLFDCSSRKIIHEIQIPSRFPIKFIYWDKPYYSKCALLAKFSVMICDNNLNDITTIYENAKVKSGSFDNTGQVFIYTTVTHMKYALPSGDNGIIKTLDQVLYIACIKGNIVTCMTRDWKIKKIEIDNTEYIFKQSLTNRKFNVVKKLIENDKLKGESILAYLQKKGYPEVALRFVQDPSTRFELAIECGNIDDAFECCRDINTKKCWKRFGDAALMQGNYRYVTESYKQTRDFEKLMYLGIITGNFRMLNQLQTIAKSQDNNMMVFNIAILNGNERDNGDHIITRIECLKKVQQYGLAYLTAKSNNLMDIANEIKDEFLKDKNIIIPKHLDIPNNDKLYTPKVIFGPFDPSQDHKYDWPHDEIKEKLINADDDDDDVDDNQAQTVGVGVIVDDNKSSDDDDDDDISKDDAQFSMGDDNNDDDDFDDEWNTKQGSKSKTKSSKSPSKTSTTVSIGGLMGDPDDIEFSDDDDDVDNDDDDDDKDDNNQISSFIMASSGKSTRERWLERSINAADMIAAGSFDLAQESLHRQFGIVNFQPLRKYFLNIYSSCHGYISIQPNVSNIKFGIRRNEKEKKEYMASISFSLTTCHEILKIAYKNIDNSEFENAINEFRKILHIIPLLIISSSDQLKDARNLIKISREYINAFRVKLEANNKNDNKTLRRIFELNCYFTHFELKDEHIFSGLYGAMKIGYKSSYYKITSVLCRRLLELSVSGKVKSNLSKQYIKQVQKVKKRCEAKIAKLKDNPDDNDNDEESSLEYKPHDYTYLCCKSLTPINRNEDTIKSSYCGSIFKSKYNGQLSPVCQLVRIGSKNQGVTINIK